MKIYTSEEVATAIGVTPETIRGWGRAGRLAPMSIKLQGKKRQVFLFDDAGLEAARKLKRGSSADEEPGEAPELACVLKSLKDVALQVHGERHKEVVELLKLI